MIELLIDYMEYLNGQIREINKKEYLTANDIIKRDILLDVVEELSDIISK